MAEEKEKAIEKGQGTITPLDQDELSPEAVDKVSGGFKESLTQGTAAGSGGE